MATTEIINESKNIIEIEKLSNLWKKITWHVLETCHIAFDCCWHRWEELKSTFCTKFQTFTRLVSGFEVSWNDIMTISSVCIIVVVSETAHIGMAAETQQKSHLLELRLQNHFSSDPEFSKRSPTALNRGNFESSSQNALLANFLAITKI